MAIDGYSSEIVVDEMTDQENLWERIHIVNRGQAPAVNIGIPEIHLAGREIGLFRPLPTLGPGESIDAVISNFRQTLQRGLRMMPPSPIGGPRILRIPLVVEYQDLDHKRWTTVHAVSFSVFGVSFSIVDSNEPQEWSDLSSLETTARAHAGKTE